MLLEGRTAIVTGAASKRGIGYATAKLFAAHGARVAILDLGEAASASAADTLDGAVGLACDVTDRAACARTAERLLAEWGRIDILVNNAGISQPAKVVDISPEMIARVLEVNLVGTLNMSRAVIPAMRSAKSGSIVSIASVAGQRGGGIFGGPHYAASKAGVMGLTKAMARELAPDDVRANIVNPGFIEGTEITAGQLTDQLRAFIAGDIPMGRPGRAEEVAGCCLFLASDLSSYVTGSEVDVNGGSLIH